MTKEQIAREYALVALFGEKSAAVIKTTKNINQDSQQMIEHATATILAAFEAHDRSQWIPISERRPTSADGERNTGEIVARYKSGLTLAFHWSVLAADQPKVDATHWRPLPTLPDTGEDDSL